MSTYRYDNGPNTGPRAGIGYTFTTEPIAGHGHGWNEETYTWDCGCGSVSHVHTTAQLNRPTGMMESRRDEKQISFVQCNQHRPEKGGSPLRGVPTGTQRLRASEEGGQG